MRVRHKPWAKEKIEQYPQFVIPNPQDYKGKWTDLFGNDKPLHIEVEGQAKGSLFQKWLVSIQILIILELNYSKV